MEIHTEGLDGGVMEEWKWKATQKYLKVPINTLECKWKGSDGFLKHGGIVAEYGREEMFC